MCHVSRVMCHVSGVRFVFLLFFGQSGEARLGRVCYQRGLPCIDCFGCIDCIVLISCIGRIECIGCIGDIGCVGYIGYIDCIGCMDCISCNVYIGCIGCILLSVLPALAVNIFFNEFVVFTVLAVLGKPSLKKKSHLV